MKWRYFGAVLFVFSVTAVVAFQTYRQTHVVEHEELASTTKASVGAKSCKYEPLSEPVTASSLQEYLQGNSIENVRDLICCLPKKYQSTYVAMHSSFAFQAGVPDSPRILLLNSFDLNIGDRTIFSFTGSRKKVHGFDHVEAFFHEASTRTNDLYDIDFSQGRARVEKNPATCMGCHSPNPTEFSASGAKPIFQDFPWPGTVGFSVHLDSGTPKAYFQRLENHAIVAMKTDPSYSCLQPLTLERMAKTAELTDGVVLEMNIERVARLIVRSKDYQKMRPLLIGLRRGCLSSPVETALSKVGLDHFENELPRWMPMSVAKTLFVDDRYISPGLRHVDDLKKELQDLTDQTMSAEMAIRTERNLRENEGGIQALYFPTKMFSALYNDNPSQFTDLMQAEFGDDAYLAPPRTLAAYSEPTQLLARYALDTEKEPHLGMGMDPYFRFLFEARGINTMTWTKEMAGTHGTTFQAPEDQLRELESNDPFWSHLKEAPEACEFLRTESFKNFQQ